MPIDSYFTYQIEDLSSFGLLGPLGLSGATFLGFFRFGSILELRCFIFDVIYEVSVAVASKVQ